MNRKQITTEQIEKARELVKDFKKQKEHDCYVYCGLHSHASYCKLLGIDFDTIILLGEIGYSMFYSRITENKYRLSCMTYIDNVVMTGLSFMLEDDTDFLELFTEEEEKKDNSLEDFFNDNLGNVVRKLKEMYPDVVSSIEKEYIKNYPVTSIEIARKYLDSDTKKRLIKQWIDEI